MTGIGTKTATGTGVELADGRIIPTSTIVATIGNGPHQLVEALGLDMKWGRIKTDRFMRVPGLDSVWALGDAALIPLVDTPGEDPAHYAPQTAQFAVREGRQLASNILAKINGNDLKPFAYTSKGSLASLGMSKAVADVYGIKLSGTSGLAVVARFLPLVPAGLRDQVPGGPDLAPQHRHAAQYRADPVDAAGDALHPLPQGRPGVRARHADRRLLHRDQRLVPAHHRQSRDRRAFRESLRPRRTFRRTVAAPLVAQNGPRCRAGGQHPPLHRAEGVYALGPRLPRPR